MAERVCVPPTAFTALSRIRREVAVVLYLDEALQQVGARHFMSNRTERVDVPIRAIVADALALDARAILLAHNHPRGDPRPSSDDLNFTRQLFATLDAIDVQLLDHYVVAPVCWTSFRAAGLM